MNKMLTILLVFIFTRPFICSLAYPYANELYSVSFLIFLGYYLIAKNKDIKKFNYLKPALVLFLFALFVSTLFSQDILKSLNNLYKYSTGALLLLIVGSLDLENKTRLEKTIAICALIISFLAIYQYFFGFRHTLEYLAKQGLSRPFFFDYIGRKRIFFPFVTPNILATYLIMLIPVAWLNKDRLLIIPVLAIALFLTKSLGAILSLSIAVLFCLRIEHKPLKRTLLFSALLLAAITLIFALRSSVALPHAKPAFSTNMRLSYWKDTLKIIQRFPFTGVGPGNFNLKLSRYAHNSYLQIWAEMGILGILGFIGLVIAILKNNLKNLKSPHFDHRIACLMGASLAFLMHNFLDFGFFLPEVSLLWWVIVGLSLS